MGNRAAICVKKWETKKSHQLFGGRISRISLRERPRPTENGDSVSGTAATSYSGAGLSRTASQSLSGGAWFLSDTSSGCNAGELFAFRPSATTGDWAETTVEPAVRGRARVALVDVGVGPEVGWNEQEDSCPRRLQEVHGCWRSHRSLECRQCWQLTGCRLRRSDARVCLLPGPLLFAKFMLSEKRSDANSRDGDNEVEAGRRSMTHSEMLSEILAGNGEFLFPTR